MTKMSTQLLSIACLAFCVATTNAGDLPSKDSSFRLLHGSLERLQTMTKRIHPRTVRRFEELYADWIENPDAAKEREFTELGGYVHLGINSSGALALMKIHEGGGEPAYRLYEMMTGDPAAVFPAGCVDEKTRADLTVALWASGISLKPAEPALMMIEERASAVTPELREEFERRFDAWMQRLCGLPNCFDPQYGRADDESKRYFSECESGDEFERLIELGDAALPLLAKRALEPGGYVAMRAFNRIHPPSSPLNHDGLVMLVGRLNSWAIPTAEIPPHILEQIRNCRDAVGKTAMTPKRELCHLTEDETRQLQQKVDAVAPETRARFDRLYLGWKQHIANNPAIQISSRTHDYATGPQMREMETMGKEIIPLVLQKSLGDFFILPLYEKLQADTPYMVDWNGLAGEADRAVRCVKLWIEEEKNTQ